MLNRRKAMMGWLVWTAAKPLAKRVLQRKAQSATPGRSGSNKAAKLAGLAALGGAVMFWRRRSRDSTPDRPDSTPDTSETSTPDTSET